MGALACAFEDEYRANVCIYLKRTRAVRCVHQTNSFSIFCTLQRIPREYRSPLQPLCVLFFSTIFFSVSFLLLSFEIKFRFSACEHIPSNNFRQLFLWTWRIVLCVPDGLIIASHRCEKHSHVCIIVSIALDVQFSVVHLIGLCTLEFI